MPNEHMAIINANIITLNPDRPKAEALLFNDGKIVAVGSNRLIKEQAKSDTKILNAENMTITPGLVDCHVHMTGFGQFLQTLDLRNVDSISELQDKLRKFAERNPDKPWIVGGRFDHERFIEKRLPTRWDLDKSIRDKPVFLVRVCGHIGVVNSKALQLAGITSKLHIEDGKVDLDRKTGEPTGILEENVMSYVLKCMPKPTDEEVKETCRLACKRAVNKGLTCVHWLVSHTEEVNALQELLTDQKLPLRIYLGMPIEILSELTKTGFTTGFGSDMLKLGFIKILADGSLGGHTAALERAYTDKPETSGLLLYPERKLNRLVHDAHKQGFQLGIHAIGDRTIRLVLQAYKKALKKYPRKNHRHRIEHCSLLNPQLIEEMKSLDLIASVQPHFAVSDFWITKRLDEERAKWVYAFRSLLNAEIKVASGSDCPVENISPILGIWAAVTRPFPVEERLTVEEAIRTYTIDAAYASFDEKKRGTIEVGKFADFTVLSQDPFQVPQSQIRKIAVEMTIVNGKIVYERNKSQVQAGSPS